MTQYQAISIAEGFEMATSDEQRIEAWQYIYDNRLYRHLQGFFGRTVQRMLEEGLIHG